MRKIAARRPGRWKACAQCGTLFWCISSQDIGGTLPERRNCGQVCAHNAIKKDMEPAFWEKVNKLAANGCWEWTASRKEKGYGQFFWRGKMSRAHRLAWKLLRGDPGDKEVAHRCDNRICVNPDHLFLATHQENMTDRKAKMAAGLRKRTHRFTPVDQLLYPQNSVRIKRGT